jgi:hypothetical protein
VDVPAVDLHTDHPSAWKGLLDLGDGPSDRRFQGRRGPLGRLWSARPVLLYVGVAAVLAMFVRGARSPEQVDRRQPAAPLADQVR